MRALFVFAATLLAAACSDHQPQEQDPTTTPTQPPLTLDHDFGVVPHGERRQHEFPIDLQQLGGNLVPLRVHLDCSCGYAEILYRQPDGTERVCDGTPGAAGLPADDEQVFARVVLDTAKREPADLTGAVSRGFVVLQPADDRTGMQRVRLALVIRFGVDSPVTLKPFAELDFGRVAESSHGLVLTTLAGDQRHADMTFANARCDHPDVSVELEATDGALRLRARCRPGQRGNHRATVTIDTNLDGYTVKLATRWKVVPDLEASPLDKISFRCDLKQAQTERDAQRQFVLVTDHNTSRSPEFAVHAIVDSDGNDATSHFATKFSPITGRDRQQRLHVHYRGGLQRSFRGKIVLTKDGADGPFLPIQLVVFPTKQT